MKNSHSPLLLLLVIVPLFSPSPRLASPTALLSSFLSLSFPATPLHSSLFLNPSKHLSLSLSLSKPHKKLSFAPSLPPSHLSPKILTFLIHKTLPHPLLFLFLFPTNKTIVNPSISPSHSLRLPSLP
ncbi:hypothetical protein AMTRI_Chr12g271420 [Amborella trichopoda]